MAHFSAPRSLLGLAKTFKQLNGADPLTQCLAPRLTRSFAAVTQLPDSSATPTPSAGRAETSKADTSGRISTSASPSEMYVLDHPVLATRYTWPQIEPAGYALYSPKYLDAPLRKDILHRAVTYEADAYVSTASTKWRSEVHGSNRKLYQQKGTGKARVRDKKSPIRRGGGVAFGPKPRDFSTELPSEMYGQAFRIALSYRLRRNELIILDNDIALPQQDNSARWLNNLFEANNWGRGFAGSLLVTKTLEKEEPHLFDLMKTVSEHGRLKDTDNVDVRDLLKAGRVVIEKDALLYLLCRAQKIQSGQTWFTFGDDAIRALARNPRQVPEKVVQYLDHKLV